MIAERACRTVGRSQGRRCAFAAEDLVAEGITRAAVLAAVGRTDTNAVTRSTFAAMLAECSGKIGAIGCRRIAHTAGTRLHAAEGALREHVRALCGTRQRAHHSACFLTDTCLRPDRLHCTNTVPIACLVQSAANTLERLLLERAGDLGGPGARLAACTAAVIATGNRSRTGALGTACCRCFAKDVHFPEVLADRVAAFLCFIHVTVWTHLACIFDLRTRETLLRRAITVETCPAAVDADQLLCCRMKQLADIVRIDRLVSHTFLPHALADFIAAIEGRIVPIDLVVRVPIELHRGHRSEARGAEQEHAKQNNRAREKSCLKRAGHKRENGNYSDATLPFAMCNWGVEREIRKGSCTREK